MTYDEWAKSQASTTPAPPFSVGGIQYGTNSTSLPSPSTAAGLLPDVPGLGASVYDSFRRAQNFLAPRPTTNPSFTPMPGERPALQMPGVNPAKLAKVLDIRRRIDQFLQGYANPPPGFRDMPRSPAAPFIPERNTQVIPGPVQPAATPYPRPPFLNFRNWMDTGERGPLPLEARRPGNYPAPYYTPMPQVYDTRTSGGALA